MEGYEARVQAMKLLSIEVCAFRGKSGTTVGEGAQAIQLSRISSHYYIYTSIKRYLIDGKQIRPELGRRLDSSSLQYLGFLNKLIQSCFYRWCTLGSIESSRLPELLVIFDACLPFTYPTVSSCLVGSSHSPCQFQASSSLISIRLYPCVFVVQKWYNLIGGHFQSLREFSQPREKC